MENDDLNEIPPHDNLINDKRFNYCISEQTYQVINEKKSLLQDLKRQRDELLVGFGDRNRAIFTKSELTTSIMLKKLNINMLKEELGRFDVAIKQNREELSQVRKRVAKKKTSLGTYVQKIEKCKEMLERSEQEAYKKTNNEKEGFNMQRVRLIEYEKQRIDELNRFIFSLVEIKPKDEDMLQKSTRTALKDARQTVYVNGRWILANDHVIYKIVRSTLPTDGDYMPYFKELQTAGGGGNAKSGGVAALISDDEKLMSSHDDHLHFMSSGTQRSHQSSPLTVQTGGGGGSSSPISPTGMTTLLATAATTTPSMHSSTLTSGAAGTSSTGSSSSSSAMAAHSQPRCIDRRSILSGLTFTVQFVNLIAFYLNILLPYNIPHNKFATQNLTDDQFQNAVAKLNTNIVYLSINQHIPVTNLLPKHTLENLHHFFTYLREMRIKIREKHSISFPNHIIPLLEEMFVDVDKDDMDTDAYGMSAHDSNMLFGGVGSGGADDEWETVPNSSEIPSDDTSRGAGVAASSRQTRTVSSSLISSVISQFWFSRGTSGAGATGSNK